MTYELAETLHLIADNLAILSYRLDAIERRLDAIDEAQWLGWALTRQIWLNPAPNYVRRPLRQATPNAAPDTFPATVVVRQERIPAIRKAPTGGVNIPTLE